MTGIEKRDQRFWNVHIGRVVGFSSGKLRRSIITGAGYNISIFELIYSPTGSTFARGPGVYKLSGFADIPGEFNVALLKGAPNPRAVYSSKAVGEPPLFLASSIFFGAAREEVGLNPHIDLISPAASARIRMACQDQFTGKFAVSEPGSFTSWDVVP